MKNSQKKIVQFPPKNQLSTDEKPNPPVVPRGERIELFTSELRQAVIRAVDLGTKFLQQKDHKLKQGPSHAAQVGKVLLIPPDALFKALEINYLLALDKLTFLNVQKKSEHDSRPDFSRQVNTYAGLVCSYLVEIIRQLEQSKSNNQQLIKIKIKIEILNAGIIVNQIMAEDHINFPYYRTQFLSHQALLILNSECMIVIERLNPLIRNILIIKCLEFKSFNAQIDIIFDICQSCIKKINVYPDNLTLLLPIFNPLVQKIINVFEELDKEKLSESDRIHIFLSMLHKLSYFAGFYFKQYVDSNKRVAELLTNGHSLIKRLLTRILTPLQSMALTVEDRSLIFEIVYKFSNHQRGFFNQDEGKVLFSLLRKLDDFITPLALTNPQSLININSVKELEKFILAEQKSELLPLPMHTKTITSVQVKETTKGDSMKDDWAALCVKIHAALASTKKLVPDLSEIDEKSLFSKLDEVSQIDIIFDICQSCIKKINFYPDNLTLLLPIFNPLVQKIIDAFDGLNKEKLSESERIHVFLSMLHKLSYFAGFYFKQYVDSNKRVAELLTNGHSLIKRLLTRILTPLQSMALTVEDRGLIFEIVYKFSNHQRGFFNQDEGKALFSLLRKLDDFITPLALTNPQSLININSVRELEQSILAEKKSKLLPPPMHTKAITSVQVKETTKGDSMKDDWAALCVEIHEALASTKTLVPDLSEIDEKSLLSKLDEVSKNFVDQADIRRIDVEELAEKLLNVGLVIKLDKSTSNLKSTFYNLAKNILKMSNKNENTEYLRLLIYCNYALNQLKLSHINQPALLIALKNMTYLELKEQKSLKDEAILGCKIIISIIMSFEMVLTANKGPLILFIRDFSQKLINKKLELLSSHDRLTVFSTFLEIIKFCFQHDLKDYAEKLITSVYDFWKKFVRDYYHIEQLLISIQLRVQFMKVIEEIYQISPSVQKDLKGLLGLIKKHYVFYQAPLESVLPGECKEQVVSSEIDIFNNLKRELIFLEREATDLLMEKEAEISRQEFLKNEPMRTFVEENYTLRDLKENYLNAMSLLDALNSQKDKNIKNKEGFLDLTSNQGGDICIYLIEIVRQLQELGLMEEAIFSTQQKLLDLCFKLCEMITDYSSYLSYYHSKLYSYKVLTLLSRFNEEDNSELERLVKKLVSIEVVGYDFLNVQIKGILKICVQYISKDFMVPQKI